MQDADLLEIRPTILWFGFGALGKLFCTLHSEFSVLGLSRSAGAMQNQQGQHLVFDVLQDDLSGLPQADFWIWSATPSQRDVEGYDAIYHKALLRLLAAQAKIACPPKGFVLLSSTSVYGESDGQWVDEQTSAQPSDGFGAAILSGEQAFCRQWHLSPVCVIRSTGIYGLDRTRLVWSVLNNKPFQQTPSVWTNRIFDQDLLALIKVVLVRWQEKTEVPRLIVAVDDCSVPEWEVAQFIAAYLNQRGYDILVKESGNKKQGKRCRSLVVKDLLPSWQYSSYQEGYRAIIDAVQGKGLSQL
jgi:nucleoside-diphosphate-sugar epimerase